MSASADGWWRDEAVMHRFVADLLAAELARLRPTSITAPVGTWNAGVHLGRDLSVDSLELVTLASALAESIHLHETGVEDRLLMRVTLGDWTRVAQASLDGFSSAMTFRTSGSADIPKRCVHSTAMLWQEIETLVPFFAGRRRILSAVRCHHIYGFLFTVLLPRAIGLGEADFVDLRGSTPGSVRGLLRAGDLVIGYPDFWQAVSQLRGPLPRDVVGVTSTAPCPADVAHDLERQGLDVLVQVYGSSETAGVGIRTAADQPYRLHSFWERAGDALQRIAPDGSRTSVTLQDAVAWTSAREFRPTGRIDRGLQVAGVNVYPEKVRRVLMDHPSVLDAAVRRMYPDGTSRLKAFIIPRPGAVVPPLLHAELERWVTVHLSAPERPKAFSFGASLPLDALGKAADWDIIKMTHNDQASLTRTRSRSSTSGIRPFGRARG